MEGYRNGGTLHEVVVVWWSTVQAVHCRVCGKVANGLVFFRYSTLDAHSFIRIALTNLRTSAIDFTKRERPHVQYVCVRRLFIVAVWRSGAFLGACIQ